MKSDAKKKEKPNVPAKESQGEGDETEKYADGAEAVVGDLVLFPSHNSHGNKTRREGVLIQIARKAGTNDGVVAYAIMGDYGVVNVKTEHVTIKKCEKSGLESES